MSEKHTFTKEELHAQPLKIQQLNLEQYNLTAEQRATAEWLIMQTPQVPELEMWGNKALDMRWGSFLVGVFASGRVAFMPTDLPDGHIYPPMDLVEAWPKMWHLLERALKPLCAHHSMS